ncbi:MAG: hypothetical protein AMXMBFR4_24180 [Candidatus Hydrogenedentota bacterium]
MTPLHSAEIWLRAVQSKDPALRATLVVTYGLAPTEIEIRLRVIEQTLRRFLAVFGDRPVRIFRCPGRINLRGMHVDTHGGHLNLMTHQREVVVAACPSPDSRCRIVNVDPSFEDVSLDLAEMRASPLSSLSWFQFITHPSIQRRVSARSGSWLNYIDGSLLRVQYEYPGKPLTGILASVGSDLPRGASLSSSAALCVALQSAVLAINALPAPPELRIPMARDAEWYAGARVGISDPSAVVLGCANQFINFAPDPERLSASNVRNFAFPGDLRVLVINSFTVRSLSGAQHVEYVRNRFAYSLALDIFRQDLRRHGVDEHSVADMRWLSDVVRYVKRIDGTGSIVFDWLRGVPETVTLDSLRSGYTLPTLDETYDRYFGRVEDSIRPRSFAMRGPLLFGIAESARARVFPDVLRSDSTYNEVGALMNAGHDGDRRFDAAGQPWGFDCGDAVLQRLAENAAPIERVPGAYGASSRALDALVDCARRAGAVGACLTGAGIAGSILALCTAGNEDAVAERVRAFLASAEYSAIAGLSGRLSDAAVGDGVVVNRAPTAACEIEASRL